MERLLGVQLNQRRPSVGALAAFSLACLWCCCFWGVQGREAVWTSLNDDLLLPYPPSQHGPQHHHRYVRDCQPLAHGNTTHESWPADNSSASPPTITRAFVSYFPPEGQDRRAVYGHFTVVSDPLRTFSVLEPSGQGGCRSRTRATVEETSRLGKCLVAQNGGYFDMDTGECLGNIVSDGQLVQTSKGLQNAQFGIRQDGTLVFGYLSEEEVLAEENPFVQLVSGVVWLLRDGEVYVNQSRDLECSKTQTTGTFDTFIHTISARTAVGHDKEGRLVLLHVDGQTGGRGLNLWEMAEFLKQRGVVNAINLDGGGSATLVLNGTLASYPSDHCQPDPMWRCPRQISTIMCVREPLCHPPDCSGRGHCVLGKCQCSGAYWSGPACDVLDCGSSNCTPHGICTEMGCLCHAGWMGPNCSKACMNGTYGDGCSQTCLCLNGGWCDPVQGSCACLAGYQGILCEETTQCLPKAGCNPELILTEKNWIGITSVLALLLLLSAAGNAKLLFCRSAGQQNRSKYTYQPLEEMNGESTHTYSAAAWKTEDDADEQDPDQVESAELI
ncbi:PREDICTED: N-acetylglucosamine-1-phosphodiester alpha-N-acetylglucosaminidase [Gekko japonicus]|uniref:N-acetylglucosamine-1-phosphodiester alpha-N-acetylglucosaminidase n=1 Tax=Gekko japonicus TaxID=146911 RepID=A0ABM1KBN2_GEKJA|nr:PREDICTED: N-acetylglucosamine-1-phosphodiester alpha-N-acetylglucosaminidase [Gekko japonicus]